MKSFLKKNQIAYLFLMILLVAFIYLFMRAWPNGQMQRYIAIAFGVIYFFWGVITHTKSKRINSEIVFEYLSVSMLAILVIVLITL
ncbi:MAG: hypothetical protein UT13_C0001G0429 [Candidatus Pacebacteria bacterium GW2011_GWF2_38_9]|nr:MAG: hypothetical protein US01_C0001G0441 [candidate division TM6 bacterium GW2011_GWF2_28_16]KKQ88782.1 MAG: hypothetical protein UT13_C0001G0429 [Candidatus Pacebacteria bacterium GW2011_GWF2_38_9]HAZ73278.1 hypothetical protein [Candidatus Paceibacterota bacterium]